MELLIRQYSESDVIPIWQLLTKEAQCPGEVRGVPLNIQQCRNLLHRQSLCLVAQVEGRVAGFLLLRPVGAGGWEQFATVEVVVTPKWRRQGIGTALVRRAKEKALALRQSGILLAPTNKTSEVPAFFVAQGFAPMGTLPDGEGWLPVLFWQCPEPRDKRRVIAGKVNARTIGQQKEPTAPK